MKAFFLIALIILSACASNRIAKKDNGSIILISQENQALTGSGFGMSFVLVDTNTGKEYRSKSFTPFSPHSFIQNLPSGEYYVREIKVILSNGELFSNSVNVSRYFGKIEIEPNSKYYMGYFTAYQKVGRREIDVLKTPAQSIPEKILKKVEKQDTGWEQGDFVLLHTTYPSDTLLIYGRRY